jgi:hypothetical protein
VKPWQRGYSLADLKRVSACFAAHEAGLVFGAFGRTSEQAVAEAAAKGRLRALARPGGEVVAAAILSRVGASVRRLDFRREPVAEIGKGDLLVKRTAALPGASAALVGLLSEALLAESFGGPGSSWWELWQESPADLRVAEAFGLRLQGVSIAASSELRGLYRGGQEEQAGAPLIERRDLLGLARLGYLDTEPARAELDALADGLGWQDHYSHYNKRRSWSALALRGYGGRSDFIEKPSEMAKAWQAENKPKLRWKIADTALRAQLPACWALVEEIAESLRLSDLHRVRLMRLAPGGGELTRHADITDPDSGTSPGRIVRLHLPLQTNEQVRFRSWGIDGSQFGAHMGDGEVWYLDTRKPHTAKNGGACDRVHLVVDAAVTPEFAELLQNAESAAVEQARPEPEAAGEPEPGLCPVVLSRGEEQEPAPKPKAQPKARARADEPEPEPERQEPAPELLPFLADRASAPKPRWIMGEAAATLEAMPEAERFDFLFTCPPYGNLEIYSDDPADLSAAQSYEDFIGRFETIVERACARLRDDRFAAIVLSDFRGEWTADGCYAGFPADCVRAFEKAGLRLYNEAVLIHPAATLPLRAARIFSGGRKLGRMHQELLVFVKGDPRKAHEACGPLDLTALEEAASGEAEAAEEASAD